MKYFDWFHQKKEKPVEEELIVDTFAWAPPQSISKPAPKKRKKRRKSSPLKFVHQPKDYRWFACQCCTRQVLASKGEKMFVVVGSEYYSPSVKLCRNCVAEIAFEMGVDAEDISNVRKRKILKALKMR